MGVCRHVLRTANLISALLRHVIMLLASHRNRRRSLCLSVSLSLSLAQQFAGAARSPRALSLCRAAALLRPRAVVAWGGVAGYCWWHVGWRGMCCGGMCCGGARRSTRTRGPRSSLTRASLLSTQASPQPPPSRHIATSTSTTSRATSRRVRQQGNMQQATARYRPACSMLKRVL